MSLVCYTWGNAPVQFSLANWQWAFCSGSLGPVVVVSTGSLQAPGVDANELIQPWIIEPWNAYKTNEKKKRLIKLICMLNDKKYEEEKTVKDGGKINIEDIELTISPIQKNIEVEIKE